MSYVENELDEAQGKLKDVEAIKRARQTRFNLIMADKDVGPMRTFGPDEALKLELEPLPAGSFKDPANLFNKE